MRKKHYQTYCYLVLFVIAQPLVANGQTPSQQGVSGCDMWHKLNRLDEERFRSEQQKLWLMVPKPSTIEFDDENIKRIKRVAEILGITHLQKSVVDDNTPLSDFTIKRLDIHGYRLSNDLVIAMTNTPPLPIGSSGIRAIPTQWAEPLDISTRQGITEENTMIDATIYCYKTNETARIEMILNLIACVTGPTLPYFGLYRIDKGPGDVCLVSVRRKVFNAKPSDSSSPSLELSDQTVIFVRGNIGVILKSNYEDFGCMDLACRLDAFLVEQMKKQKGEKEKSHEDSQNEK